MAVPDLRALPDVITCVLPDPVLEIPEEQRGSRAQQPDENFVLLDGQRGFIRCRLELATHTGVPFAYVAWFEMPRDKFEVATNLWKEPTTRALMRIEGTLANLLPPFEEEIGCSGSIAVLDWRAPMPAIVSVDGPLARYMKPPGLDFETHVAVLGEALREGFAAGVEEKLAHIWGPPAAYEEFETKDWHISPRHQVIAEFQPGQGEPWRYCTLGLSSRPMPGGDRVELAWEVPRRITDDRVFRAMANIAAHPWRMRIDFFDGYVLPVPGGFPPGSEFKFALCYDAARAYSALDGLAVFDQRIRILMPLPLLEREKANLRMDETKYLDLKDFLR